MKSFLEAAPRAVRGILLQKMNELFVFKVGPAPDHHVTHVREDRFYIASHCINVSTLCRAWEENQMRENAKVLVGEMGDEKKAKKLIDKINEGKYNKLIVMEMKKGRNAL